MADTKRNYTGLSAIFPDNTNQSITPQDLRDGFKSVTGSYLLSAYSTNSTLSQDDVFIDANTDGGNFTLSLPAPSGDDGSGGTFKSKFYYFHNSGSNLLTVSATGLGNTISGGTNVTIGTGSGMGIISNGVSDWRVFQNTDLQSESTVTSDVTLSGVGTVANPLGVDISNVSLSENDKFDSLNTTVFVNSASWDESVDITTLSAAIDSNTTNTTTVSGDLDTLENTLTNHLTSADVHFVEDPNWDSTYTTVYDNSASWVGGVVSIPTSANWNSAYTNVTNNSATWETVTIVSADLDTLETSFGSHVTSASVHFTEASIDHTNIQNIGTNTHISIDSQLSDINSTSGTWDSTYTTVNTNSATWETVTTVSADLDTLETSFGSHETSASVHFTKDPNWDSTYTSVNSNSATWNNAVTHITSDGSDHTFINQNVTTTGTPTFGSLTVTNNGNVGGDFTVTGNMTVLGNTFSADVSSVMIEDNVLLINNGETGHGITTISAGILIDRGTASEYAFVFDDARDLFVIGETSGTTQAVATREDVPNTNAIFFWNSTDDILTNDANFTYTVGTDTLNVVNLTATSLTATNLDVTSNILVGGTVDGRDVAADGTKLDSITVSDITANTAKVGITTTQSDAITANTAKQTNVDILPLANTFTNDNIFNQDVRVKGDLKLINNLSQVIGGIGTAATSPSSPYATWSDVLQSRSGNGYYLSRTSGYVSDGPTLRSGDSGYAYPFTFEHITKDGTGARTQFAIPYANANNGRISYRGYFNGTWNTWTNVVNTLPGSENVALHGDLDVAGNINGGAAATSYLDGTGNYSVPVGGGASGVTNLTEGTTTNTTVDVDSSTGTNATLAEASTSRAGVMSKAKFDEVVANTAKDGITTAQANAITANTAKDGITTAQANAIIANTAKDTNVTTNLSEGTTTNTTVDVNSSDGTNATLAEASASRAGVMSKAKFDEVVANTAKVGYTDALVNANSNVAANTAKDTNVTTNLSEGTTTNTTVNVDSSDGTNATLAAASTSRAGVMSKAKFDEVVANTAKTGITTGQASAITANTAKVGLTDGDKGDIVVSNTGTVLTIDTDVVTTDKILDDNVTFAKTQNIATNKLLGRSTANAGSIEEITLGTNLSLSSGTLNATGSTETDTLANVTGRGATTTTTSVIPFYYSNQSSFPNATTYHGAIAHSHSDGAMYFAHGGVWNKLANSSDITNASNWNSVYNSVNTTSAVWDSTYTTVNTNSASWATDTTNVTNAGALMDSEVTNLTQLKTFDSSDYATAAQGTLATDALPKSGGAMTGAITTNSTFDGRDVATDGTKLDSITVSDITANTAKDTNVTTNLSEGTTTNTSVDVNSSDGTNATIAAASTTRAGVMSKAKFDEVVTNTAKTGITSGQASAITANTAKDTNVTTNLSEGTTTTTTVDVNSSDGTNATIAAASTSRAGVMTKAKFDEVVLNTAKNTNVTTNLSEGTTTNTSVDVNSSDGTNATLAEASTSRAGVMSKAKFDEVVANTAKDTNVTTNLSEGTTTNTSVDVNSSDGTNATLAAASTSRAGVMSKAKFDEVVLNTAKVGLTDGDKGDIVVSSTGTVLTVDTDVITTTKILDDNVTFAKTQNIATDKLLGRGTAGTGSIEEITLGTNLSLTGTTLNAAGGGGSTAAPVYFRTTSTDTSTNYNNTGQTLMQWTPTGAISSTGISLASNRFTVTDTGQYDVYASAYYLSTAAQRIQLKLTIWVNGSQVTLAGAGQGGYARYVGDSDNGMSHVASLLQLNANDYVEIKTERDGIQSGTANLISGQSVFKMHKLQGLKGDKGDAGGLLSSVGGGLLVDLGFGTTNQAITTGNGATTINFDDTVTGAVDKHGNWDNTNKKFIVNTASGAGTYQFEVNLFSSNSISGYYNLQAFINGAIKTPNGAFAMSDAVDDSSFDGVAGTISLDLNVGDEVEIKLQSYNATTTISANGTWNFTQGMRVSKTSGVKGDPGTNGVGATVDLNKTLTLEVPTASEDITIFRTNVDITVQEVIAVSTGSSPSTTYVLRHDTDRSATGTLVTASAATTSITTGDIATLSDATIPADSWVWFESSAANANTGVVLSVSIRYTED